MAGDILVFCEQKEGAFRSIAFECLTAGKRLAGETGGKCVALVAGPPGGSDPAALAGYGAAQVLTHYDPSLAHTSPEILRRVLLAAKEEVKPAAILMGATSLGKDLAPRLAAALGVSLAADCTALSWQGGSLVAKRPIYAGKAYLTIALKKEPFLATLRPKAFTPDPPEQCASCEVGSLAAPAGAEETKKYEIIELKQAEGAKLDLTEADIIVSGGRGLKGPENFKLIEDLAAAVGGVVGASRAVVDAGWRPHGDQVGQTGKTVSPTLYIACGISGAIQHLAGMRTSKVIVAINKDPEAPIFKLANYGIVGDVFEVLPVLTEKIRALKAKD